MTERTPISQETFDYFETYREKIKSIRDTKALMRKIKDDAQAEITRLYEDVKNSEKEAHQMRRIITRVIEDGIDSVEARLTPDDNQVVSNMWQNSHTTYDKIDPDSLTIATQSMIDTYDSLLIDHMYGAVGATGAVSGNPYGVTTFPHTSHSGLSAIYPTQLTSISAKIDPITGKITSY